MIKRSKLTSRFTIISNEVLERQDLSLKAKGLWAYVMSKPDGWQTSVRGLCAILQDGNASIRSALKELEKVGLYQKRRFNDEQGKLRWEDVMFDAPCVEKPHVDKPCVENRTQVNTNIVSTEQVNTTDLVTNVTKGETPTSITEKTEYGDRGVNRLFVMWEEIVGYRISARNTANRRAAYNLLKKCKYDFSTLERILQGVEESITDQFSGVKISDFVTLQTNFNQLLAWGRRNQAVRTQTNVEFIS